MLEPGLQATVVETVTDTMTAERLGSGDVPVLGSPALLALVEAASVAAVTDHLEAGSTTVGSWVELHHVAPTEAGVEVTATAALREVDGSRLTYGFEVTDPAGPVARGTHRRVVVDRSRFLAGAGQRRQPR
jgi:fluoroacetyl-CoA thioesterase